MNPIENKLNELYGELYEIVAKRNEKSSKYGDLTICPAVPGSEYNSQNGGIMFVGRAINGWCPLPDNNAIEQLQKCANCTLNWVIEGGDYSLCAKNNCEYAKSQSSNPHSNMTPFWNLVKYICEQPENNISKDWLKKIVWTNLYKASYVEGGNPVRFYKPQLDLCNKILIKEIELYKPKKIYFITEPNRRKETKTKRTWFCENDFKKVYDYLKNQNVEAYVLTRPEFKNLKDVWDNKEEKL